MAMAMAGGALPDSKRYAVVGQLSGTFDQLNAMALSGIMRLTEHFVLSGGIGYGMEMKQVAGRTGLQFAW